MELANIKAYLAVIAIIYSILIYITSVSVRGGLDFFYETRDVEIGQLVIIGFCGGMFLEYSDLYMRNDIIVDYSWRYIFFIAAVYILSLFGGNRYKKKLVKAKPYRKSLKKQIFLVSISVILAGISGILVVHGIKENRLFSVSALTLFTLTGCAYIMSMAKIVNVNRLKIVAYTGKFLVEKDSTIVGYILSESKEFYTIKLDTELYRVIKIKKDIVASMEMYGRE